MVNSKKASLKFDVDKYIRFSDFEKAGGRNFLAAIVGCIEGNIQMDKENSRFILFGMYNVKCRSKYLFLSIYNFIKSNGELCNFIIKYFNLWHDGGYEEFTYDEYHKNELSENFKILEELIHAEMKQAVEFNDSGTIQKYEDFYANLFLLSIVTAL